MINKDLSKTIPTLCSASLPPFRNFINFQINFKIPYFKNGNRNTILNESFIKDFTLQLLTKTISLVDVYHTTFKDNIVCVIEDNIVRAYVIKNEMVYVIKDNIAYVIKDNIAYVINDNITYAIKDNIAYVIKINIAYIIKDNIAYITSH